MKVIYGVKKLKIKNPTVVTIGMFDGIHKGHKKILRLLRERAKKIKAKSCVLTFTLHPAKILYPRITPPMLISTEHKLNLIAAEGIDIVVLIDFTKHFANINAVCFAEETLAKKINVKELLVGKKFLFGKNRLGTATTLKRLGQRLGFDVHTITPLRAGKRVISSTLIRRLIMSGKINDAKKLMGRDISILGTVTKGSGRGRILGFPTANLDLHHEAIPPRGVYIVKVRLAKREYRGILNIGFRPTFKEKKLERESTAEVHIFNFNSSIYGKDVEVVFLKRIRSEHRFKSRGHLVARIKKDIRIAKRYFGK